MSKDLKSYEVKFPEDSKIGTVDCRTVNNHYYGMAKNMKNKVKYTLIASISIVLLSVGLSIKIASNRTSQKSIESFEPIEIYEERGGTILRGIDFYNKKKFNLALQEFESSKDSTDFVMFYKANCLMYVNRYEEARQCLNHINENRALFIEDIEWLTALSFYYQENIKKAIVCLTHISVKDHKYSKKASNLLSVIYENKK